MMAILPLTIFATSAFAADRDYYVYAERGAQASTTAANDFNGVNFGVSTGFTTASLSEDSAPRSTPTQVPVVGSIGFSHTWNQFYMGVAGQFGWNFPVFTKGFKTGSIVSNRPRWQSIAEVQVGGLISGTNLIHLDAGYALGHFNYLDSTSTNRTYTQGGPTVGMGVSLQLSDHVNFDMNYHFIYYLNKKGLTNAGAIRVNQHLATVGLSFHFG